MPDVTPLYGLTIPNDSDTLKAAVKDIPRAVALQMEATMANLSKAWGPNLLSNPSFEVDAADWGANNGTLIRDSSIPVPHGTVAGAYTSTAPANNGVYTPATPVAVWPGEQMTAAIYFRKHTAPAPGAGYTLRLYFFNLAGAVTGSAVKTYSDAEVSYSQFIRMSVTGTAPAGTVSSFMEVAATNVPATAGFWVDAAYLGRGSVAPPASEVAAIALTNADLSTGFTTTGQNTSYRKVGGTLNITLQVNRATAWAANSTLFVLPAGYRPPRDVFFSATDAGNGLMTIKVAATTGVVSVVNAGASGIVGSTTLIL